VAGGDQGPDPLAYDRSGGLDTVEDRLVEFCQGTAERGRGGDRAEQVLSVAQDAHGAHRVPAAGHHAIRHGAPV
jgi:hypothetical protein